MDTGVPFRVCSLNGNGTSPNPHVTTAIIMSSYILLRGASTLVRSGRGLLDGSIRWLSRNIGQPTHFTHPELLAEGEILPGMSKKEFAGRRMNLIRKIADTHTGMTNSNHLVIIPGAPVKYMSADVPYRFHQNTDLLYLTGFQEPDSVLLLVSNDDSPLPECRSVLYVRPRDPYREMWDGPRAGTDGAVDFLGVDEAYTIDELGDHLENRYSSAGYSVWYYTEECVHPEHDKLIINSLTSQPHSTIKSVHSPSSHLAELRLVKSPSELALMRKAGQLAADAFKQTMRSTKPGVNERELESVFEQSVKSQGAQWMAFPPVVAGGERATCLHYISNNRTLHSGELVLMDAGCEYHGYVSDVTRTWPVSGQFTPAQRDLYEIIRMVKQETTQLCKPGVTLNYLHSVAVEMMASELKAIGVLSYRISATKLYQAMNVLYPHHLGHFLGMDTHDTLHVDRNLILAPNMVVTIEPGIYIPQHFQINNTKIEKEFLGVGIRLEDDIVVTENGAEVINQGTPETIDELSLLILDS